MKIIPFSKKKHKQTKIPEIQIQDKNLVKNKAWSVRILA